MVQPVVDWSLYYEELRAAVKKHGGMKDFSTAHQMAYSTVYHYAARNGLLGLKAQMLQAQRVARRDRRKPPGELRQREYTGVYVAPRIEIPPDVRRAPRWPAPGRNVTALLMGDPAPGRTPWA